MRTWVVGSVAAAAALAGAVVSVVAGVGDGPREPAGPARPPFAILERSDAVPAVEGDDYEVEHRVAAADAKQAVAMLPDGDLAVVDRHRLMVLDPATGRRTMVGRLGPRSVPPRVTLLSSGELVRSLSGHTGRPEDPDDRYLRLERFDPRSREVATVSAPQVPQDEEAAPYGTMLPGADGRFYFTTGTNCAADRGCAARVQLWSFEPGQRDKVRHEASSLEEFAMAGSTLVWIEDFRPSRTIVHTRDLVTGEAHTRTIRGCGALTEVEEGPLILASSTLVVVRLGCASTSPTDEHLVLDTRARPLARLRVDSHGVRGVGDRWVVLGDTAYDSETGRLLRIERVVRRSSPLFDRVASYDPAATAGNRIVFRVDVPGRGGSRGTWVYARMSAD